MKTGVKRIQAIPGEPAARPSFPYQWLALSVLVLAALVGAMWWSGLLRFLVPAYHSQDVVYSRPLAASHGLPSGAHTFNNWKKSSAQPNLSLTNAYHDFGTVPLNKKVDWIFAVANNGNAPLVISRAYTTCECTSATFSAAVVPPGKVSLVSVTFDPSLHGYPGATVRRGIIFDTDDPDHPQAELWIQARLR
jgi:hypothetical protein